MELTGKCKDDFLNSLNISEQNLLFGYSEIEINALIIEFFDSVGIIIQILTDEEQGGFEFIINYTDDLINYKTRQEATTEAIKKANEIYNNK